MERMGMKDDEPIEHRWVTKQIESAQKKVEGHNFNIRKNLLEYDDVMNLQRKTIYALRKQAVLGEDVRDMIDTAIISLTDDIIEECMDPTVHPEEWHVEEMREHCQRIFGFEWEETDAEIRDMAYLQIRQKILGTATELFGQKEEEIGTEIDSSLFGKSILSVSLNLLPSKIFVADFAAATTQTGRVNSFKSFEELTIEEIP